MRSDSDPRTDDAYEDDRYDDRSASPWLGRGWTIGYGWPPVYRHEDADETVPGDRMDGEPTTADREDDSWWDEGLISLLLIAGVVLFFFPEPATSMLGVVLMLVGAVAWLADALT